MKQLAVFFLAITLCTAIFAQSQYAKIEPIQTGDTIIYSIGKDKLTILQSVDMGGLSIATISISNALQYRSPDLETQFTFDMFYNQKLKEGFLFVHKQLEFSRGCEVFHIKGKHLTKAGELHIAAYNKLNKTMDYNSILPYISIVKVANRVLLSLETPLVVLNPAARNEQIIESKRHSYAFENGEFVIKEY